MKQRGGAHDVVADVTIVAGSGHKEDGLGVCSIRWAVVVGAPKENDRIGVYRLVERLATTDTADVLLAKADGPMGFERTVVLKVLLPHLTSDEGSAGAFAREAAAYARLSDPAIVTLYEFAEHEGRLMMALEHVDGAPLADVLAVIGQLGRMLDDKTALYVAQRIFAALANAHRVPIIHRDVNPSNVLLSWEGEVKLTDFGFARFMGATHQSAFGIIKGTFGYMAPEQIEGGAITSRTDIYAAGVVLWELLAHQTAFPRGRLSEIEALTRMAEPNLTSLDELRPDLPQRLRNAVTRALRPKSEDRDVSASEMVSILRGLVPTDIGRDKLATWLDQLRPHLGASTGGESNAVTGDEPTMSYLDVQPPPRATSSSRVLIAASTSGASPPTAPPPSESSQTRPLLAGESTLLGAPPTSAPALEETTHVMAAAPVAPTPAASARELPPAPAPPPAIEHATPAPIPPAREPSRVKLVLLVGALGAVLLAAAVGATYVVMQRSQGVGTAPTASVPTTPTVSVPTVSVPTVSAPPSSTPPAADASPPPEAHAVVSAEPLPLPPSSAAPPASASSTAPAKPSAPPDKTIVRTEGARGGRRIFVDGRSVGQTPSTVIVPCGSHEIRLGSSGVTRQMDLPCGGEVTVADR